MIRRGLLGVMLCAAVATQGVAQPSQGAGNSELAGSQGASSVTVEGNGQPRDESPVVFLYVNSKDTAHLNSVVENALRFAQKRRLRLGTIYQIGDYRTLSSENTALAQKLGVRYEAATKVGYSRGITMSPTWIFVKNGEPRVVEGYMNIEPFIATEGLPPPAMKLDAIDTPHGELKGF
jgi:hypothetical protein